MGRGDRRPQPFVGSTAQGIEHSDLLQRRGATVHHARSQRDALKDEAQRLATIGGVHQLNAAARERCLELMNHYSSRSTGLPPRNRFDQSLSHFSPSSSAIAGSMISWGNLLSGVSTARLEGTRLTALKNSCPSRDSRNSVNSSAAYGRRESFARPTAL